MKHFIFFTAFCFTSFIFANDGSLETISSSSSNKNTILITALDPGHNQKRQKDQNPIELYLGVTNPSLALKLNFFSQEGLMTEAFYVMLGMDFDTDLHAKFGINLNPTQRNRNSPFGWLDGERAGFSWFRDLFPGWRYVHSRHALEIGYKGQFLDSEEEVNFTNENYGGVTCNLSYTLDGTRLVDKVMWRSFDQRTARRLRLKLDLGVFYNLDQFDQPDIGFFAGSNASNGTDYKEDNTQWLTYPVFSIFAHFSLGFAF